MKKTLFKRIFYLEPFLIKTERHFIETTLAADAYFSCNNIPYYIIGNKNLDDKVLDLLPRVIKGISQTCYESMDNQGESFFQDLISLNKKYKFNSSDLIIIPTAYENQILGVSKFARSKIHNGESIPKIAIQFHQLFPPTSNSDDVNNVTFRRFWLRRLRAAFSGVPKIPEISYWTTHSRKLNQDFKRISGGEVGILPVPYLIFKENSESYSFPEESFNKTKIAFLGEGRQEKGLLYFLRAIMEINKKKNSFFFFVQNMNPRGYPENEKKELDDLLEKLKSENNVIIVDKGIHPLQFHSIIKWMDAAVMPYNPINYYRRISGILTHAAIYEKPLIVSSSTWSELAIRKHWASGLIFDYHGNNRKKTVKNLVDSLYEFARKKDHLFILAKSYSDYFKNKDTYQNYINIIFLHYEK